MSIIKKYSNRRLYDTDTSRYITLEELAAKIREGANVRVVDAKTNEDLTQLTLTQLVLEGPASRLLPVDVLHRLVRMHDDAIAEFFSRYVSWALDLYLAARDGAQQVTPWIPMAGLPLQATNAILRWFSPSEPAPPHPPAPPAPRAAEPEPPMPPDAAADELVALRRELEALKAEVKKAQ